MKIRTKLFIFPIVLAVMLIVSLFITLTISNRAIRKRVGNHLLTTVQSRANHCETLLHYYKKTVQLLAVGIPFTDVLDPQIDYTRRMALCNLRIKRSIETDPVISRIRIINKNGIVIASSHEDLGSDLSEKAIFIKGKESVYIGEIHKSEYTGNLVLSISATIFVRDIFSGVLIINFDVEKQLYAIFTDRTGLGETGEIYLVNRDGHMISPSRFINDAILKTKPKTEQVNLYLSEHLGKGLPEDMEEKVTEYLDYRGKKVLGVHYYISEMQWGLITEFNVEEAYKMISKQTVLLITVFTVLLIVIIIIAVMISRDITLPIKKLHEGTEEIIKGNIDHKVGIESKDEIGRLSRSFDIMTDRLKKAQKELKSRAEELDKRVREKTAELEKQFGKSEKQRIASLVVLNDLNKTTKDLKAEITERKKTERELQERMNELETFFRATLGREGRVIELKQEVNELSEQLGKNKKYGDYS